MNSQELIKCEICNKTYKSKKSLSTHIRHHNLTSKEYYDTYMKKSDDGICKYCGNETPYISLTVGYQKHCCIKCSQLDKETQEKIKKTNRIKYNADCVFQSKQIIDKIQQSIHDHYGELGLANPEITEKKRKTKLKKYGSEKYTNTEKMKATCLKKYNSENPFAAEEIKEKIKTVKLERYGDPYYHNVEKAKKTFKNTIKNRTPEETLQLGKKLSQIWKNKSKQELEEFALKISNSLKKYYDSLSIEEYKNLCERRHLSAINRSKESLAKSYEKSIQTKLKNNTYNSSSVENDFYDKLLTIFKKTDIKRQYYDKNKYPYACDFYIKPLDLFIEINNHWTHGSHPFDNTNINDIQKLDELLEKAKNCKFYQVNIYVWTDLDVQKYNIAKENKLNYMRLYTNEEITDAINYLKETKV